MGSYYQYNNGISYPYHQVYDDITSIDFDTPRNPLYSDPLTSLCRSTEFNLERIKNKLIENGPHEAHNILHWRPIDAPENRKLKELDYPDTAELPKWDATKSVFSSNADRSNRKLNKQKSTDEEKSGMVNFCYLCSTLEEHQQHLARRGMQLKEKKKVKPRITYIPPPPTVKFTPKEIEQKDEVVFKFLVKTGQFVNAGTSANVTVKLKGNNGIMTKRPLKKIICGQFTFGRSTTESFFIKGPDIGDLSMLAIEHDGLEQKHAWFLEEVEVINLNTEQSFMFVCNDWLSLYHGDYQIKRVMRAEVKEYEPQDLEVTVVTADKSFAGTDANVFITVYGQKGVSRKMALRNKSKNNFEKGQKDKFYVSLKDDIGKISKIRLEHDNSGAGPGWLVEQVIVHEESSGHTLKFPCGRWLAKDEDDGQVHRDLFPTGKSKYDSENDFNFGGKKGKGTYSGPVVKYEIIVLTGKLRYAGTDARVYMTLLGKSGWSQEFELADKSKDLFEQRQTDVFQITAADVGDLKRIQVRHDNSGLGAGWYVEKITIKRYFSLQEVKERLAMMQHETDEVVQRRTSQISGQEIDSPKHRKKHFGSRRSLDDIQEEDDNFRKQRRKKDSESDSDNIRSPFQKQKKNKKKYFDSDSDEGDKKRKGRKHYEDSDDSDDGVIGRGKVGKRGKKQDSDSDTEITRRKGRAKKTKWIQHAGYRIEVTDSEAEEEMHQKYKEKKRRKHNKFNAKYPTDSSSDSEDDDKKTKKGIKKKKSSQSRGKYYSESDEEWNEYRMREGRRKKRNSDEDSEMSEDDDDQQRSTSVWKENRIPSYDEYIFHCNKWLAKDEADGLINREFKASTVTTFYKVK